MDKFGNCDYFVHEYKCPQCYAQKNAPEITKEDCEKCQDFKQKSTTYREQFVGETDEQYEEYKTGHDNLFNNLEEKLKKAEVTFIKDDLKQAVADEFKYRARFGRNIFTMEEVIYIVNEVIDEVNFEENEAMPQDSSNDIDMQIRIIKGDLQYLSEKVDKLSSLIVEQKTER